ncbi:hypothetical protein R8Z50_03480 [Longispora sp. K20-0274]|uniref:hypothetical protein n=1 Tax=Longispora sp. K20-0274 TaxID=3088255 RepID=UPI00399B91E5
MEALRLTLRYVHLIGFALLLGGVVVQYLSGKIRINSAMLAGSAVQLLTGIALAAPLGRAVQPDPAKLAVKGVIALLIFIMVWVVRKKESVATGHFLAIGGMTLINAGVATFWH